MMWAGCKRFRAETLALWAASLREIKKRSGLRPLPTGLARLISEQTFQEQARIRRHTLLREQRTYPPQSTLLASTTSESWLPMDSDISQRSNCNARRGVNVTVYGQNPWNSMLTFSVDAGPVRRGS
jgi:hypothetical protein